MPNVGQSQPFLLICTGDCFRALNRSSSAGTGGGESLSAVNTGSRIRGSAVARVLGLSLNYSVRRNIAHVRILQGLAHHQIQVRSLRLFQVRRNRAIILAKCSLGVPHDPNKIIFSLRKLM